MSGKKLELRPLLKNIRHKKKKNDLYPSLKNIKKKNVINITT